MHAIVLPNDLDSCVAELESLRPGDLPAPPGAALGVMQACADPSTDAKRLTGIVSGDPALAAEILRIVNSAYFGFARKVSGLEHAVTILGHRSLRNLVLCLAVRDALGPGMMHDIDTTGYWRSAAFRAVAAKQLAVHAALDADECFTLGLLLDLGFLAMFCLRPDMTRYWGELEILDPARRKRREREIFGWTHDVLGAALLRTWDLPEEMVTVVARHHAHKPEPAGTSAALTAVASCADWIAAVFCSSRGASVYEQTRQSLATAFGLGDDDCTKLFERVHADFDSATDMLGLKRTDHPDLATLLTETNLKLAEGHLDHQELSWRLQSALDERDRLTERVREELDKARVVQRSLLPPPLDATGDAAETPFAGINAPARELSGDFYDFFALKDGRYAFVLADVSGKGMDAALMMAKTSSLFHCLGKLVHDPRKLLTLINSEINELSVRGMFVTMVAGVYEPDNGTVKLINAGHPPPLIVGPGGEVKAIAAHTPPLGVLPSCRFEMDELRIDGSCLYIFSDGLLEAKNARGEPMGDEKLIDLIRRLDSVPRAERPTRLLSLAGETHSLAADDVTILVLQP